ncbi:MAG: ribose transport system substrate-binding protein [Chloroflexota bacterium]|nr:ribose transport system substrate-binding protein [Chloroflexota bacterium]
MRIKDRRLLALMTAAIIVAAACSSGTSATTAPSTGTASQAPASAEASASAAAAGFPLTGPLKDGSTFTLAPRIATKLTSGDKINYVFSYQSASIPLFSAQYKAGYDKTIVDAQGTLAMNGQAIAPVSESGIDVPAQIAQIEALINTDQVDCLSIEPPDSNAFTAITNSTLAKGIPVFTVGVTSNGNEFTNFTQIPEKEGTQAANIVLKWMADNKKDLKVFAVSGGDPTAFWAQGRMKFFKSTIMAAIPDATFLNDETNALATTFDAAKTLDAYKAFIAGNPTVQFIENVDIGAEHAYRAIKEAGKEGSINTIGWNVSLGQLDAIDAGTQVAALDQKWSEQAGFGALACAEFLKNGKVLPNSQELLPVTKENSAQARKDLQAILDAG